MNGRPSPAAVPGRRGRHEHLFQRAQSRSRARFIDLSTVVTTADHRRHAGHHEIGSSGRVVQDPRDRSHAGESGRFPSRASWPPAGHRPVGPRPLQPPGPPPGECIPFRGLVPSPGLERHRTVPGHFRERPGGNSRATSACPLRMASSGARHRSSSRGAEGPVRPRRRVQSGTGPGGPRRRPGSSGVHVEVHRVSEDDQLQHGRPPAAASCGGPGSLEDSFRSTASSLVSCDPLGNPAPPARARRRRRPPGATRWGQSASRRRPSTARHADRHVVAGWEDRSEGLEAGHPGLRNRSPRAAPRAAERSGPDLGGDLRLSRPRKSAVPGPGGARNSTVARAAAEGDPAKGMSKRTPPAASTRRAGPVPTQVGKQLAHVISNGPPGGEDLFQVASLRFPGEVSVSSTPATDRMYASGRG
jgi:hypothetical protein